jgi:hypothetical protein
LNSAYVRPRVGYRERWEVVVIANVGQGILSYLDPASKQQIPHTLLVSLPAGLKCGREIAPIDPDFKPGCCTFALFASSALAGQVIKSEVFASDSPDFGLALGDSLAIRQFDLIVFV